MSGSPPPFPLAAEASEEAGAVTRALSAEGRVAGRTPEAGVPAGVAGPIPAPDDRPGPVVGADPSSAAGGGGRPAVLLETGGPSPLAFCAGTMLAGAGLLLRHAVRRP